MTRLLLVEDDEAIAAFVRRGLEAEGHVVEVAESGAEALELLRAEEFPLVILDRMLPDIDGMHVSRRLRSQGWSGLILMLTAKDRLDDKVDGLRSGADDYLTKPFSFDELLARIDALLRRGALQRSDPMLRVSDLTLDPTTRSVRRGGREITLTAKEFALLRCLMENPGAALSRSSLLSRVWGYSFDPGTKLVDVYILYLRRKIDGHREKPLIHTIRGVGYRLSE